MKNFVTEQELLDAAPGPIISYIEASKLTGNLVKVKTLQNLASKGELPKRIRLGSRVGFRTKDFIAWFLNHLEYV